MVYNGPCQQHTRLFGPSPHRYHAKQSLASRLRTDYISNSRLGFISVGLMLSHSTPRVAFVAHPLPQLKATQEATDRDVPLGVSSEGNTSASRPSFIPPHPTPASAVSTVSSQHHPTPRVPRPTREWAGESRKVQRENIFSFSNVNSLLALKKNLCESFQNAQ